MTVALTVKTAPANDALWLSDAKTHLRIRHDNDNRDILLAIKAATAWVEHYTERSLITRTYELGFTEFADVMELLRPPLITVNAVTYYDSAGVLQTLDAADYHVGDTAGIGWVAPLTSGAWPATDGRPNGIIVDYDAGYGDSPLDINPDIAAALKLVIGHFYENREQNIVGTVVADLAFGAKELLAPYRIINV